MNVEGAALNNIDIYAETGGRNIALIRQVNVTVADGQLNLSFTASVNNALINGIEVIPAATVTPTRTNTPAASQVLDDFEDGSLSDWTTFKDTASSLTIAPDSAVKSAGTYSLRMNYTIEIGCKSEIVSQVDKRQSTAQSWFSTTKPDSVRRLPTWKRIPKSIS